MLYCIFICGTFTFFEIWGICPCYFAHVEEQDFQSTWLWDVKTRWNSFAFDIFDCICWFIVPVTTDSSVFIGSNVVWNRWKRSIRVYLSQRRTNCVNTVYFVHQGKSSLLKLALSHNEITNRTSGINFDTDFSTWKTSVVDEKHWF